MTITPNECYFDVKALFAGLNVSGSHVLADGVLAEAIFENNLVAQVAQTAKEVLLGMQSDPEVPIRPVCGLTYRVRGTRLFGVPDDQMAAVSRRNEAAIASPALVFRRAIAARYGVELLSAGTFVWETDHLGNRRLFSHQFNTWSLSVHYDAVFLGDNNVDIVRHLYGLMVDDYMSGDGKPLGVAIDRLGSAAVRTNPIDANLDLCIAAEIAFLFGVRRDGENEKIAESVRENARVFFGDGEFFWGRDEVADILRASYSERSNTVHGRRFNDPERLAGLVGLNGRLREVLKAALVAYVERRPARLTARRVWPERLAELERGDPLRPIFT